MAVESLSERMKIARKEKNLTQQALAEALGVGKSYISKWERGAIIDLPRSSMQRLAEILEIPLQDFLDDYCEKNRKKEAEWNAAYPRVKSSNYDIEFLNNTHESLEILECIDDHVEGELFIHNKRKKGAGTIYLYKKFRCKCYLCGREYEFLSRDFVIRNDAYGSRATWGYYCEACCDCHAISSFQWRTISIFHEYNVPYKVEVSFPDLLNDKGNHLRYDFAILNPDNSIKCLIECQGKQHFQIGGGYGGYSALAKRQKHDELKCEYAKNHNIQLHEIPYTYNTYDKEVECFKKIGIIEESNSPSDD